MCVHACTHICNDAIFYFLFPHTQKAFVAEKVTNVLGSVLADLCQKVGGAECMSVRI